VGFVCKEGTTENVTLYTESEADIGADMEFWALKTIDSDDVPVENLTITIYRGDEVTDTLVTDNHGYFSFIVEDYGSYEVCAGDLNYTFELKAPEPEPVACTLDAKLCPDGSYVGRVAPDCEFAPCPEANTTAPEEPMDEPQKETVPQEAPKKIEAGFDWAPAIIIIIIAAVILLLFKKKCCRQRKSSGISGRRKALRKRN
jgi:hypothetical protein